MVPKAKLDALHARHQGVAARLAAAAFVDEEAVFRAALDPATPLPLVLALDQVQDPGNVGALVRTLYGLGGAGIVLPRHNSAFLGPGAAKASAGTLARLPVAKVTNLARSLEQAEAMGLALYAAGMGPEAANAFAAPLELPAVLVLGNEDKGVRPGVAKRCRATLAVPLARDLESLNVAQAGALLLGCFARGQRM
jgi:23S rRNA (guanosine2251-2'-O)-methyltransferase